MNHQRSRGYLFHHQFLRSAARCGNRGRFVSVSYNTVLLILKDIPALGEQGVGMRFSSHPERALSGKDFWRARDPDEAALTLFRRRPSMKDWAGVHSPHCTRQFSHD